MTVFLVTDPLFGKKLANLIVHGAVWIVQSPTNSVIVEELRKERPQVELTTYNHAESTPHYQVAGMIETIELHHPELMKLEVIGAGLDQDIENGMRTYGFSRFSLSDDGFVAFKSENL